MSTRHKWSAPRRDVYLTFRDCVRCGLIKITHHEGHRPWISFERDGRHVESAGTPACEGVVS